MKLKVQFEDVRDKLKHYQEENLKMTEQKRIFEDRQSSTKFASQSIKSSNREKDNEIYNLKEEIKALDLFKQEKPKLDKKTNDLQKLLTTSRDDLERKTLRIKDLEKLLISNKSKFDEDLEIKTNSFTKKVKTLEQEIIILKKIEKEYNLTHQSTAFLTQHQSNVDYSKKIEELENKIKLYVGKLIINLIDEIENEANKCKVLEDKHEELEYQKLQLLAAKKSVDEDNIKLSSENVKFIDLVKELNEKLEKYKGLENSLFEAVTKKDDGDKQVYAEFGKKQIKIENNENEENPYRQKKKDNNEAINLDKKVDIHKDKNEAVKLVKKESKKEKFIIEEKDLKKSNLETDDKHKDKSKENALNKIEKSVGNEQSKEKKEELLQIPKENIKDKSDKVEKETKKIKENINEHEVNVNLAKNDKEGLKMTEKNELKDEHLKKENDSIKPIHDLKNELKIENKKVENVIIKGEIQMNGPTKDGHTNQGINNQKDVNSDKQVDTDKNGRNKNVIEIENLKPNDEIKKNIDSDRKTNKQEINIKEPNNNELINKEKSKIEKVDNKEIKNNMEFVIDNLKENLDNKEKIKGIEIIETNSDKKDSIKDNFNEFDDYFVKKTTKDYKLSSRKELDFIKIHSENKNDKEKSIEIEKLPSKEGNLEFNKQKEKIIENHKTKDKISDKHKPEETKPTEKIIDNNKPIEEEGKLKEKNRVKESNEPKDNVYNFEDSIPGGDIPGKFGGGFGLKNIDKDPIDKKPNINDIEYNYDDFIVDSNENNLFPKGK